MLKACTTLANAQLALASEGGKALVNGVPITAYGWQLQSHGDEGSTFSIVRGDSTVGPFACATTTFLDEAFKAENTRQGREHNPDDPRRFRKPGSTGCGTTKSYKGFGLALRQAVEPPAKKLKPTKKPKPASVPVIDTALDLVATSTSACQPAVPTTAPTTAVKTAPTTAPTAVPAAASSSSLDLDTALGLTSNPAADVDWSNFSDVDLESVFASKLTMDILQQHGGKSAHGSSLSDMLHNVVQGASVAEMQAILRSVDIVPQSTPEQLRRQLALA